MESPEQTEREQHENTRPSSLGVAKGRQRRWLALLFVGLAAVAAIILIIVNVGEISGFAVQAARAEPRWLAVAALFQLITYAGVALVWSRVLSRIGHHLHVFALYPLAIAKLFADQAVPSGGLSGAVFFFHALAKRQVPHRVAFSVFLFTTAAFFTAFLIAAMLSLAAIATAGDAPSTLSASIAAFAAITLFVLLAIFIILGLGLQAPSWVQETPYYDKIAAWIETATKHISAERRLFLETTFIQFAVRCIDGLTLFVVFFAIGGDAPYAACFFAVAIASVAATVAPMPMGLGTFEAGMIATLNVFGVPLEDALTATLVFRGVSLWLPLIPGFYIIQREILRENSTMC